MVAVRDNVDFVKKKLEECYIRDTFKWLAHETIFYETLAPRESMTHDFDFRQCSEKGKPKLLTMKSLFKKEELKKSFTEAVDQL